ncbi:MAG: hypothetical protein KBG95_03820 [Brachymonas sp.]|jgi:hypothetical protein|nr:hypothetical protein [Brachymonas sp.]
MTMKITSHTAILGNHCLFKERSDQQGSGKKVAIVSKDGGHSKGFKEFQQFPPDILHGGQ